MGPAATLQDPIRRWSPSEDIALSRSDLAPPQNEGVGFSISDLSFVWDFSLTLAFSKGKPHRFCKRAKLPNLDFKKHRYSFNINGTATAFPTTPY